MVGDPRALGNESACHAEPDRFIGTEGGVRCDPESPASAGGFVSNGEETLRGVRSPESDRLGMPASRSRYPVG